MIFFLYISEEDGVSKKTKKMLLSFLWYSHFTRRIIESCIGSSTRRVSPSQLFSISFGYSLAACLNQHNEYTVLNKKDAVLGTALFVIGEIGNFYHHFLLKNLRNEPKTEYKKNKNFS